MIRLDFWECKLILGEARATHNHRKGVREGVIGSGLPGLRAQSAVFLIHAEGLRQAPRGEKQGESAGRPSLRSGCYHTRSVNVL
jgi:hypothetical protein